MKKVLLIQKSLQPPGGGNAVAVWIIEALRDQFALATLTWDPVDLAPINRFYGTSLKPGDFKAMPVNQLLKFLVKLAPDPHGIQRLGMLMRQCRLIRHRFDVVITADNEFDFGRCGIQYLHYPVMVELHPYQSLKGKRFGAKLRALTKYHWRPWRVISGFSFDRMKQNTTLCNSHWTADAIKREYGIEAVTVYPPVAGDFPGVAWADRHNGFVAIGRIVPEKNLETVVEILAGVRRHVPELSLCLVGTPGSRRGDVDYHRKFVSQVAVHDWITFADNPSRQQLVELVSGYRYGIHGFVDEHFGMGVAEMVAAGCLPFLPDGGGQREVIGNDSRLLYGSVSEAVEKISSIVLDPRQQRHILDALAPLKTRFSEAGFARHISAIVGETQSP